MSKKRPAREIRLVPRADFEKALRKVLSQSKEESDRKMEELQASNKARRQAERHSL